MLIAIFADIHANRQAFSACLAQARGYGAERIVLLGDYVGYGADPEWTVATVMELVDQGAVAVLGNHDSAIGNPREQMNMEAQIVIEWTRGELGASERQFLAGLPFTHKESDRLYVHADASNPRSWIYVKSTVEAARSISATLRPCQLLRPHPPAGALQHVGNGQDDRLHADHRHGRTVAARTALARGARLGRAAARPQSGGLLCHARYRKA